MLVTVCVTETGPLGAPTLGVSPRMSWEDMSICPGSLVAAGLPGTGVHFPVLQDTDERQELGWVLPCPRAVAVFSCLTLEVLSPSDQNGTISSQLSASEFNTGVPGLRLIGGSEWDFQPP